MVDLEVVVVVPRLAGSVPHLHEAHAALDQSAGNEQLARLGAFAVELSHRLRLALDVEGVGRIHLHAVGQLKALYAGVELGIGGAGPSVFLIEFAQEGQLPLLGLR